MFLATSLLLTLTGCCKSESEYFPVETEESSDVAIDTAIVNFKSSVLHNAQKIKSQTLQGNYTRANICDDNDSIKNKDLVESLEPVLAKSKELLSGYGVTDENLKEIFTDDADANAIILAIAIAGTETETPVTRSQVANCALDALGIPVGLIVGGAKNLSKKAILKAAKKLATRSLGWVGAAIAVVDFAACMDYI